VICGANRQSLKLFLVNISVLEGVEALQMASVSTHNHEGCQWMGEPWVATYWGKDIGMEHAIMKTCKLIDL